ncbi:hypothetical protein L6R52_28495 [Myxococcota bacterium]|nr:hypothetical protein [Myxococcota bacterium]
MALLRWLLAVALAAPFAAGGEAFAHKTGVKRLVMVEPSGPRELQVIVALRVPAGRARKAIELLADVNRDGQLQPNERAEVESVLVARALDGLVLHAGTSTLTLARTSAKLKTATGPLELMILGVATLPSASTTDLALTTGTVGDPVDLVVLAGTRPVTSATRGAPTDGALKATLGLGDRVAWKIR